MKGYRVRFTAIKDVLLEEYDIREPREKEVLIRVYFSLISNGTEKAYLLGTDNTAGKFPTTPGYSSVGVVEKVGHLVKSVKVGDRVFCAYGGHSNYNIRDIFDIHKIPDGVTFLDAVFTKIASFPLLGIRKSRIELGESCVIVGLGMLGLFGVQLANLAGANPIIGVGNREERLKKASLFGAEKIFESNDENLIKGIQDYCEKRTYIKGANVVIETSGSEEGLLKALQYVAQNGRVVLTGCNRINTIPIDLYKYIHLKGVSIIGAHGKCAPDWNSSPGSWTRKRDYRFLLNMMEMGKLNCKDIFTKFANPYDASEIYDELINNRMFPMGMVFDWRDI